MKNTLLIIVFIMPLRLLSQNYAINQLGIEHGLSNSNVVSITQDKDGFSWFATEEGLNKFDGSRFINYYKHDNSISGNELNAVYADPSKPIIWIGTQRAGFNAFNYEQNTLTVFKHNDNDSLSLTTNDITDISASSDPDCLWISTFHQGVELFNKETGAFTHYNTTTIPNLISDGTWTVTEGSNGNVYIGHVGYGMSVVSLKDKRAKSFTHNPTLRNSIPGDHVRCIYEDNNGNIWVGTNRGLAFFDTETEEFITLEDTPHRFLSSYIYDIKQFDDNMLWVATELNGICIIDLKQYFFMPPRKPNIQYITVGSNKYSLSNATVRSVFQDSFKNIWIGTYGGGINFIGKNLPLFDAYRYSPIPDENTSLNNRTVLSLCTDAQNRLWVGTDGGGINLFEGGRRIAIYNKESGHLTHNSIQSLFKDSQENIWIGTFTGGVNLYDNQKGAFFNIKLDGKDNADVRCFYEDSNHLLWIGTSEGFYLYDIEKKRVTHHYNRPEYQLPDILIRSIAKDKSNQLWVGTFGNGIGIYDSQIKCIKEFNEYNGFCSNTINHIYKDSQNRIWVGTGDGLVCFTSDSGAFDYQIFLREDGLSNTFIRAITEDDNGNIWFSSNAGISCFLSESKSFLNYHYFNKELMGNFISNAVTNDEKGNIHFGSINGTRFFDPIHVLNNREVQPAKITQIDVFEGISSQTESKKLIYFSDNDERVDLTYKQNTFNIFFNVLDYSLINQVDYAYRLKGLNNSWHTIRENNVMFRNIPPGSYEFQVQARIHNKEWTEHASSLFIHITPPVWLSLWAKVLYSVLTICIILFLLYAYKKWVYMQSSYRLEKKNHEQEQELNNERLRFFTNITHELRTPLTLILGPLEDLQKDIELHPKQGRKIAIVHQSAIRLLNLINQILEFRKVETQNRKLCISKGNIAALVKEIGLKYKELNRKSNVEFIFHVQNNEMIIHFDKEILMIILDNLISNAIKYTDRGKIELSIYYVTRNEIAYTEIKVRDTGYGIALKEIDHIFDRYYQVKNNKQASGTGIGLSLVKNLVALHEGEIWVESELGKGSCFYVSLLTHNIYPDVLHADDKSYDHEIEEEATEIYPGTLTDENRPILLVVEDNLDIRDYIMESFAESFEVIVADEGEDGCIKAFNHIPDVIVSDIMMPGMNGILFCKKIKEDIRTSHIPIILLTAKDSLKDKEEGYIAGADSYLTKPFSASLLCSRINNLLESRKKIATQYNASLSKSDKNHIFRESLSLLDNEFMQNITKLIEENLESEKNDVSYLSDKMFMSSSTLYRKIKALTGISTNEYIRKIKMKNAERLLLKGRYNISEIAFQIGIGSPGYFRQCFKEEFGVTPSEYIKRLKEKNTI